MKTVEELCVAARQAFPDVGVSEGDLARHLTAGPSGALPDDAREIFLALGCARADPAALKYFLRQYLPEVDTALARMKLSPSAVEDVRRAVEDRLLLGHPPRIGQYAGKGGLAGLVRVVATRIALNQIRDSSRLTALEDAPALEADGNPELRLLKERFAGPFKSAFQAAVAELSSRERNLLRLQFVERLSVDQIGALFGVHRATAARWVAAARRTVARSTRQRLSASLKLDDAELASLTRAVRSELQVSLSRILRSGSS